MQDWWFDLGPHLADQALQLFGLPDAVTADLASLRAGSRTDDWAHVILDYPRRRVVPARQHARRRARHHRFVAHGTAGTVVKHGSDIQEDQLKAGVSPGAPGLGEDPEEMLFYDAAGRRHRPLTPAGDQLAVLPRTGPGDHRVRPQSHTPQEILAVMAVVDAARGSADGGTAPNSPCPKTSGRIGINDRGESLTATGEQPVDIAGNPRRPRRRQPARDGNRRWRCTPNWARTGADRWQPGEPGSQSAGAALKSRARAPRYQRSGCGSAETGASAEAR